MKNWKKLGIPSIVAVAMIGTVTTGSMSVSASESQQEVNVTEEESSEVEVKAPNKAPEHLEIVKTIEEPTDEENGSITVANATTVKEMLRVLEATDGSEQSYEVTGEDGKVKGAGNELATNDQFVVTAEDGTEATYTIIEEESNEVEVEAPNKAPEHLEIIKTIEEPTDDEKGSITVANATKVKEMLRVLEATDGSEQTYEVTGEDGKVKGAGNELATNDRFVVTAEDGTEATYTIIEEESNEVEVKAPNKAPEHLEIVKTIEEPTEEENGSITVANATTVKEMLRALAATDGSEQTYEVTGEDGQVKGAGNELATDDKFVVTAEDGTEATYTIIVKPAQ